MPDYDYYIVHSGTNTILDLDGCKIVAVKSDNDTARECIYEEDIDGLLENADMVFDDENITLG